MLALRKLADGRNAAEIATILGRSLNAIRSRARKAGIALDRRLVYFDNAAIAKIKAMAAAQAPAPVIAQAIGKPLRSVRRKLADLGLNTLARRRTERTWFSDAATWRAISEAATERRMAESELASRILAAVARRGLVGDLLAGAPERVVRRKPTEQEIAAAWRTRQEIAGRNGASGLKV